MLEALKKIKLIDPYDHDKVKTIDTETFNIIEELATKIDINFPNTIKYRSPLGLVYGIEFLNIQREKNTTIREKKINNLFERATKISISPFDIVRYYRYITYIISI